MKNSNNIIISSSGIITSAGTSIDECFSNMLDGKAFIHNVNAWDSTGCTTSNYGEIYLTNNEIYDSMERKITSHIKIPMERGEILLFKALEDALKKLDLASDQLNSERVSVIVGTSLCGFTNLERDYRKYKKDNSNKIDGRNFMTYPLNAVVDRVCYEYGIKGKRYLFSTACSASLHSILWAEHLLDNNEADLVIVGGTDPLSMISMAGFSALRSMAKDACSPYSVTDPGISVGEGAGVIILENQQRRLSKGNGKTEIFLSGVSSNCDAYHPTASDPMGTSIKKAIEDALDGIESPEQHKCLFVSHGTGTMHNDQVETRAIKQVKMLNGNAKITSIKSMIGHTLGASGVIELALLSNCIESGKALPTVNFTQNRPGCDLDYVKNKGIDFDADFGIKSAFAFGGNNVVVSLTKGDGICKREKIEYDKDSVAITGIGTINGYSTSVEEMNDLICSGKSSIQNIEPLRGFNRAKVSSRASIIDDAYIDKSGEILKIKYFRKMDRISKISTIAAIKAVQNSGIKINALNSFKIGLISGTGTGPLNSVNEFYDIVLNKGAAYADAGIYPNVVVNAHAGYINLELKIKGYTTVITHGSISGMSSMDLAVRLVKSGMCEAVLVGSTSEYCRNNHRALIDINTVDDNAKAYCKDSKGIAIGEGSTFFVVEKLSNALKRNAKVHGVIETIKLSSAPVIPSTYKYSSEDNPLIDILKEFKECGIEADMVLGEGAGIYSAAQLEMDAIKRFYPELTVRSYTDFFGHISGASTFNNVMQFCLNKPSLSSENKSSSKCLFTCMGEGGMAGALIVRDFYA